MNTDKAAYWIALGVLTLGLNSEYRHGNFVAFHRAVEHADSVLCRIAAHAEQGLTVARALTNRENFAVDNVLVSTEGTERARDMGELMREQAREKAEFLRDRVLENVRENVRDSIREKVRAQSDGMRAQAELRRLEMDQIQRSQFRLSRTANRHLTAVCAKTGARVAVSAGPEFAGVSPDVEVEDTF